MFCFNNKIIAWIIGPYIKKSLALEVAVQLRALHLGAVHVLLLEHTVERPKIPSNEIQLIDSCSDLLNILTCPLEVFETKTMYKNRKNRRLPVYFDFSVSHSRHDLSPHSSWISLIKTSLVQGNSKNGENFIKNTAPLSWLCALTALTPFKFAVRGETMRTSCYGYDNWKLVKSAKLAHDTDSGYSRSSRGSSISKFSKRNNWPKLFIHPILIKPICWNQARRSWQA